MNCIIGYVLLWKDPKGYITELYMALFYDTRAVYMARRLLGRSIHPT